jgi:cytochrome c biogenesis protein
LLRNHHFTRHIHREACLNPGKHIRIINLGGFLDLEKEKNTSVVDRIWDFLASVRLAIVIFALISATSVIGTILEQRTEPERNIQILSKLFGESLGPWLYDIFHTLGFMDMYRSWWFMGLLIFFSVNLVICSLERLPRIWRLTREPVKPLTEAQLMKIPLRRELVLKGTPDAVKDTVAASIKDIGFRPTEAKDEKGYQFCSEKGNFSRLGVYVTHFSILIIMIGAILGITLGFKGHLNLPEGAYSDVAFSGMDSEINLGFAVRCDNFDVDYYPESDMPKEYRSWLTILKDGKEVVKKSIVVNDPLTYEGITFYQSSYGYLSENITSSIFMIRAISREGKTSDLNLRLGDSFQIPGTPVTGRISDFSPALRIDAHGHAVTYSNQMSNPAVLMEFSESGKTILTGWILKRYPETWVLPQGHRVEFLDVWGVEFTGLQVRKDPGVWVVYLGCFTISIGLFIAFFMSHRKIWVKLVEDKRNTRVLIGATANKNRPAFERKIEKMLSILAQKQERGQ